MRGWAMRVKDKSGYWVEIGWSTRVKVTLGNSSGKSGAAYLTAEAARELRRALSRAIRAAESGE